MHFSVCRVDWIKAVGKVPCNFFPPGKCKEQTLWLLKGSFVMPNKFIRVSLKPAFTGILWKEKLAFFMLLLWHNGTQHVVSPLFFDSPFSIFFQNKNKNQPKTWCRLLSTESCQQFVFQVDVVENNSLPKEKTTAKTAQTIESTSTITKTTKRRKNLVRQTGYFPAKHFNVLVCG